MGHQKILSLLNDGNDTKFASRKWNIFNDNSNSSYASGKRTTYNNEVLKSSLCHYNDAYI